MTRERRSVFGEVAELYDRVRPTYPGELFDAVIEFGGLPSGARALEVGAGTGKATMAFVERGLDVVALEPDAEMAAVLRAKNVQVVESTFEDWSGAEQFSLLYAAQAWHWVDPMRRIGLAYNALAPGGTIALFWNVARQFTGGLFDEIDAAYARHAPELREAHGEFQHVQATGDQLTGFTDVTERTFVWSWVQTTADYVALHKTHSNHRMLPEDRRSALHDGIAAVIDARGGTVEVVYDTLLFMALRG